MKRTLSLSQNILVGSMLHLGQEAGSNIFLANIGFMLTAIGLPFLGIVAMGISRSEGLFS